MPGYGELGSPGMMGVPGMMDGPLPGMPSEDEMRKQQAKEFTKNFIQQRSAAAEAVLQESGRTRGESPLGLKVKTNEGGVSALGGTLNLPLSKRIGVQFGGGYAVPQTMQQEIMGQTTGLESPGQFSARAAYKSPFVNIEVEHSPNRGFSGYMGSQARW
jgi:hypothetical protein